MKDFSLTSFYAIASEFFGSWLYLIVAAVFAIAVLAILTAMRGTAATGGTIKTSIYVGAAGGLIAMAVAPMMTGAGFANLHGALDWMSLLLIGVAAFVGCAVAAFGILGIFAAPRRTARRA